MSNIEVRRFGRSDVTSTGFGAGFAKYAGFEESVATVRRALELGIRYFDTSPLYRAGASQVILGEALEGRSEQIFLATKIGHFAEARFFRSVDAMHAQFRENLRLLRRESVDLLQIHEADWDNWWMDRGEVGHCKLFDLEGSFDFANAPVIQFLREMKARGLCRHIGITGNNARHLGRLIRELDGFDSVLVAYNYQPLNVSAREHILPTAAAKNMSVLVAGLYTFIFSIPKGWRTEGTYFQAKADEQLAELHKLQQACGIPLVELSARFVAADERITSLLVGACHPAEIEQNVAAIAKRRLPDDIHAEMERIAVVGA